MGPNDLSMGLDEAMGWAMKQDTKEGQLPIGMALMEIIPVWMKMVGRSEGCTLTVGYRDTCVYIGISTDEDLTFIEQNALPDGIRHTEWHKQARLIPTTTGMRDFTCYAILDADVRPYWIDKAERYPTLFPGLV